MGGQVDIASGEPPIARARVVILCGLPGVGKLTIAKGSARLRGFRLFHNHLVFDAVEALFDFGSPSFIELRERLWLELLTRATRERVGDIVFTIARDQSLRADFLVSTVSSLSDLGARVYRIELTCSAAELERRISAVHHARRSIGVGFDGLIRQRGNRGRGRHCQSCARRSLILSVARPSVTGHRLRCAGCSLEVSSQR